MLSMLNHVVSMVSFVDQKSKMKNILVYAAKWGLGHGSTLLLLGALLVFLDYQLPYWFVHYAEMLVGIVLIYLGLRLWLLLSNKSELEKYKSTKSKYNNSHTQNTEKPINHEHTPLFIGMLHGVAGSAPVFALLPHMVESQFLLHIGLFSLGCLLGMFFFGFRTDIISMAYKRA